MNRLMFIIPSFLLSISSSVKPFFIFLPCTTAKYLQLCEFAVKLQY